MTTDPSDSELVLEWDRAYELTESPWLWGTPPVPYVVETAGRLARLSSPVLELPCGDGRNTVVLAQRSEFVIAADTSRRGLRLTSARLDAQGLRNSALVTADALALPFEGRHFGGVLCWDLLGHLRDPLSALNEAVRVSRPGATIVANVFALGDSTRGDEMRQVGDEEYVYQDRLYFRYYDEDRVRRLLGAVGGVALQELTCVRWTEPPHEGYREYEHEHESWAFVLDVT